MERLDTSRGKSSAETSGVIANHWCTPHPFLPFRGGICDAEVEASDVGDASGEEASEGSDSAVTSGSKNHRHGPVHATKYPLALNVSNLMRLSWGEFLYPALQQKVQLHMNKYNWKISNLTHTQLSRSYFTLASSYLSADSS